MFYERAKLTGVLYKHRVIFAMDGCLLFIGIIYSDILDKANYSDPLRTKIDERKKILKHLACFKLNSFHICLFQTSLATSIPA